MKTRIEHPQKLRSHENDRTIRQCQSVQGAATHRAAAQSRSLPRGRATLSYRRTTDAGSQGRACHFRRRVAMALQALRAVAFFGRARHSVRAVGVLSGRDSALRAARRPCLDWPGAERSPRHIAADLELNRLSIELTLA